MIDRSANKASELKETSLSGGAGESHTTEIDLTLLQASLRLTPWERMQANDDALNFGETLRAAMKKRHAEPE